ncbi:MAG: hypothetical protein P1U32_04250 [Legionellaceae bacterium]|nr:hypothetical protein [Legionellaceae bacterium]
MGIFGDLGLPSIKGFFSKKTPKNETPAEKEKRLVGETFDMMIQKLKFIQSDLESTFPVQKDAIREIEKPMLAIREALETAKDQYDKEELDLNSLKAAWKDIIEDEETGLIAIEVHLKTSSMVYHHAHKLIQAFLQWSQSALEYLGVLSPTEEGAPPKKPWIKERENSAMDAEDVRHFEKGLPTDEKKGPEETEDPGQKPHGM